MSSHRSRGAYAVDPRAAGRRRVVGATSATALGGTALAVFFGSLFAQAFAEEAAAPKAAPVQAALTVPQKHATSDAKPKPPAAAPQPAAGEPVASSGGS